MEISSPVQPANLPPTRSYLVPQRRPVQTSTAPREIKLMSSPVWPNVCQKHPTTRGPDMKPGPLEFFGFVRLQAASWTGSSGSYVKSCARAASGPTASPDLYAVCAAYKPLLRHFLIRSRTILNVSAKICARLRRGKAARSPRPEIAEPIFCVATSGRPCCSNET